MSDEELNFTIGCLEDQIRELQDDNSALNASLKALFVFTLIIFIALCISIYYIYQNYYACEIIRELKDGYNDLISTFLSNYNY